MANINVRVRGMCATAISKLLLDHGYNIVQASSKVRNRLNIEFSSEPPDVTVKDSNIPGHLILIGWPKAVEDVLSVIVEELKHVIIWRATPNIHSTIIGRVVEVLDDGRSIVEISNDGLRGVLRSQEVSVGELLPVCIERPMFKEFDKILLSRNIRIIGKRATLILGRKGVQVSRHIMSKSRRRELITLGLSLRLGRWGVKWRSSAAYSSLCELAGEVKELVERGEELLDKASNMEAYSVLVEGQRLVELGLTSIAKRRLDEIRGTVIPTIPGHHLYKSWGEDVSTMTDLVEDLCNRMKLNVKDVGKFLGEFLFKKIVEKGFVEINHVKALNGRSIKLTPGRIIDARLEDEGRLSLKLRREIRGRGVYDGLKISKEPGDYDIMRVDTDSWIIVHEYRDRDHNLKGWYININMPPEVSLRGIKYYDLHVDVVVKENSRKPEVIDLEELERLKSANIITSYTYNLVLEILMKIDKILSDYIKIV